MVQILNVESQIAKFPWVFFKKKELIIQQLKSRKEHFVERLDAAKHCKGLKHGMLVFFLNDLAKGFVI